MLTDLFSVSTRHLTKLFYLRTCGFLNRKAITKVKSIHGNRVAFGTETGQVNVFDIRKNALIFKEKEQTEAITGLAFVKEQEKLLATCLSLTS